MKIDLGVASAWAGAIMTILGLIGAIVKPMLKSFTNITKSLTDVAHSIDMLNRDIEASQQDRSLIHNTLQEHDKRLDNQDIVLAEHKQQLVTLFKREESK